MLRRAGEARVAVLGTIGHDGRPHLVPVTFALSSGVLFSAIDRKPKSTTDLVRLANIERDSRVTVLVQHYADDWTQLWWVRADGVARILAEGVEREQALATLAARYQHYREDPPTGPVIAVEVLRWTGWAYEGGGATG